jgi:hypothetical protein
LINVGKWHTELARPLCSCGQPVDITNWLVERSIDENTKDISKISLVDFSTKPTKHVQRDITSLYSEFLKIYWYVRLFSKVFQLEKNNCSNWIDIEFLNINIYRISFQTVFFFSLQQIIIYYSSCVLHLDHLCHGHLCYFVDNKIKYYRMIVVMLIG